MAILINAKYDIGTHVWIVYACKGEVSVYDTHIRSIEYEKDGLCYYTEELNDYSEDQIILYEDKNELLKKIVQTMNEIHESEKK